MTLIFILFAMIFAHIIDDFYLQGILASMKQKSWWTNVTPESMYSYDYIAALIIHSMSWTFMILLPLTIYYNFHCTYIYFLLFLYNAHLHAVVDDLKANKKIINLCQDQFIHLLMILSTFWVAISLNSL